MSGKKDLRTYLRADCAVFRKTAEAFGGLSNMAPGFPVRVNGVRILTVEALYQACRFPHRPEVQRKIIEQHSPMTAKMVGKPYRNDSRPDWDRVRVKIMRWVLRLKLAMHWTQFSELLLSTGDQPIVEDSRKDDFWGAIPIDNTTLVGMNVLGRLLMELREEVKQGGELRRVEPPEISDFFLFNEILGVVDFRNDKRDPYVASAEKEKQAVNNISLSLFGDELVESTDDKLVDKLPQPAVKQRPGLIANLGPYSAYKDSGLTWLDKVPSHWGRRRMKFLFSERTQKGFPDEPLLAATQTKGVVRKEDYGKRTVTAMKDFHLLKLVQVGDFVISLRSFEGGIEVSHCRGIISPAYTVLKPSGDATQAYYSRLFKSADFISSLTLFVTGIREGQNIDYERMSRDYTPLPPVDEQLAIGRFLDWANARLERTIRAKRRVIALLTEQKQAIIHRAVTRGLDPNVSLKPSGIAWLGDIPAHWETRRSKYLFREVDERSASGAETHLSMSQKFGLIPNSEMSVRRLLSDSYAGAKLCQPGDMVLNRLKAHLGVFALAPQSGLISPDYTVFRPICALEPTYFEAIYRSPACRVELYKRAKGIVQGFWRLYTDDFYDIGVPVPPIAEQTEIMAHLAEALGGQNTAISRLEREIDLLREYRTRLVADVVTGKLDVREAAARLPQDELEAALESEALDPMDTVDAEAELDE